MSLLSATGVSVVSSAFVLSVWVLAPGGVVCKSECVGSWGTDAGVTPTARERDGFVSLCPTADEKRKHCEVIRSKRLLEFTQPWRDLIVPYQELRHLPPLRIPASYSHRSREWRWCLKRGWIFLTLLGHVGWVHSSQLPPLPYCSITAILGAPSPFPRELQVGSYSQRPTFSSSLQAFVILSPLCRLTKSQDISLEAEQEKFSHMRVSLSNHKKYIFNPTNYVFTIYNGQGVYGKGAVIRKNMNQLFSCCNFKSLVIPSDERDVETITHRCACTREPIQSSHRLLPSACRMCSKTQGYFWETGIERMAFPLYM